MFVFGVDFSLPPGTLMPRLDNKIALITGAARGIGSSIARLFAQEGATVLLCDIRDEEGSAVAATCAAFTPRSRFFHLDVQHESEWLRLAETIERDFGRVDVVVNNAGITGFENSMRPHDPENINLEDWRSVHAVNLDGVLLGCKYAIRLMKTHGGSIINMSSRSGIVGIPRATAYASSKAAVRNHTKSVALYTAEMGYRIRCNSIHPAAILTPLWDAVLGEGEERERNLQSHSQDIPLRHFGEPDDVAYAALYLASDESTYITGIELTIDGGILAGAAASPRR